MARVRLFSKGKFVRAKSLGAHPFFVGRDPVSDLLLEEPACSRQHFCLTEQETGGYLLEDLDSSNGTFVDGVREYKRLLTDRAVIQVGRDLILFEPDEEGPREELPQWALDSTSKSGIVLPADDGASTVPVAPAIQRRALAEVRAQTRPHLVSQSGDLSRIYPLDTQVVAIGFGPVAVSLGPSRKGDAQVLAEIVHVSGYDFRIRAKGLFARIQINGKPQGRARLDPGDRITVGGVDLVFRLGLVE